MRTLRQWVIIMNAESIQIKIKIKINHKNKSPFVFPLNFHTCSRYNSKLKHACWMSLVRSLLCVCKEIVASCWLLLLLRQSRFIYLFHVHVLPACLLVWGIDIVRHSTHTHTHTHKEREREREREREICYEQLASCTDLCWNGSDRFFQFLGMNYSFGFSSLQNWAFL